MRLKIMSVASLAWTSNCESLNPPRSRFIFGVV
jgi:hypothetical protein